MDAIDYDIRLAAYGRLRPELWRGMRGVEALPLLHQCMADLRNAEDLALRNAAVQALARFVDAAACVAASIKGGGHGAAAVAEQEAGRGARLLSISRKGAASEDMREGTILPLVQRVLYSQLKRTLASSDLSVRQVCC